MSSETKWSCDICGRSGYASKEDQRCCEECIAARCVDCGAHFNGVDDCGHCGHHVCDDCLEQYEEPLCMSCFRELTEESKGD